MLTNRRTVVAGSGAFLLSLIGTALAQNATEAVAPKGGTPEEAKAMAIKAAEVLRTEGAEKAAVIFGQKDGPFWDRDLYVYVWNTDGKCLINPGTPALVGKTLIDMKDVDGSPIIRNLIAVKDQGFIEYHWPHPITHKVLPKVTYVVAVGDLRLGVGAYK